MRKLVVSGFCCAVMLVGCGQQHNPGQEDQYIEDGNQKKESMKNLVAIVEIPVKDLSRAITFYEKVLAVSIETAEMGDTQMGVFPSDGKQVSLVLVKGADYKPGDRGALVYLNAGKDLQPTLERVEKNGGKVLLAKTEISPEMGYFAFFSDTEGNKMGLHSSH